MLCLVFYYPIEANALEPEEATTQTEETSIEPNEVLPESEATTALESLDEIGHFDDPVVPDIVYDETELENWVLQHSQDGGTVTLGNAITITQFIHIKSPVTIDTGAFGLILDGSNIQGGALLHITGEGVDMPVVEVISTRQGFFYEAGWNNNILGYNITAVGKDGNGGTALLISQGNDKPVSLTTLNYQGYIRSIGKNAVGIKFAVPNEAYCFQVEVSGENSTAVSAPNGVSLYYCKLFAEGAGAAVVREMGIILDTCFVAPEPQGIQNFNRSMLPEAVNPLYLPIRQYKVLSLFDIQPFTSLMTPLSGGDGYESVQRLFPVKWELNTFSNIDTSVLGKYSVAGNLGSHFQGIGLDNIELALTVEVRDPALPCIEQIMSKSDSRGKYFQLHCWDSYDWSDGTTVLWRSDNEGKTWKNATGSEDILWNGRDMHFYYDTLEQPVWFVIEIVGVGDSNVVSLSEKGGMTVGGTGGDRTGTDREGAKPSGNGGGSAESGNESGSDGTSEEAKHENMSRDRRFADSDDKKAKSTASNKTDLGTWQDDSPDTTLPDSVTKPPSIWKPVLAGSSIQRTGASTIAKVTGRDKINGVAEKIFTPGDPQKNMPLNKRMNVDQEQTAPAPSFPIKTAMILTLSAAVLCCGALLYLRLRRD